MAARDIHIFFSPRRLLLLLHAAGKEFLITSIGAWSIII
jgi:hypothetical protein